MPRTQNATTKARAEKAALEWFAMPDGRPGFRGVLGGLPRLYIGRTKRQAQRVAHAMAMGRA
jgi:hypothetical protein